ncbi:unnamed protein product [Brassica napus]|uniref:(rape) hypothetical protein n=1 Tax=Brassica napus TaxID=3708 RepID=A0A816KNL0_BRANA|nr:unnamed protein product [Brassica napus]
MRITHYDKRAQKAGIAWIISDGNGTQLNQGSSNLASITSPLVAEAIALRSWSPLCSGTWASKIQSFL